MLKAAIEKIIESSKPVIEVVDETRFAIFNDGAIEELKPACDYPSSLRIYSLDSLVKMVKTEALVRYSHPIYITIPTHTEVYCFSSPMKDLREMRLTYYTVHATDVPGWDSEMMLGFEEAIIAVQTRFQESKDTPYLLKLLSEISSGSQVTYSDNGIATSVVTRSGVSLQSKEAIRPILNLKPYRTFQEVDQPESKFLIRISERGIKFVEADGGMWKLKARQTVRQFLEDSMRDEIEDGKVVISL